LTELRVDGGASVMDLLLQLQADQLGVPVTRPSNQELTALGAAYLAGLAEGVWDSPSAVSDRWQAEQTFVPTTDRSDADAGYRRWLQAVDRSRDWADHD
jgi:glycerol kinase